jgi:enoyl-CoA hydratase/carnithine racemase
MSESVLLVERVDAVATLTLNRPASRNAVSAELVAALAEVVPEVAADGSVRAVVLTGAGGAFCSGADLKTVGLSGADQVAALIRTLHEVIRVIAYAPKPFIAAVDGAAVGFGCDLALACDLRVLSTRAYFQESFVKVGLMPDGGGTYWLPRLVGMGRALEYMMLGERIVAEQAHAVGLANRIVDASDLPRAVATLAASLAKGPPLALDRIKRAVREHAAGTIERALDRESAFQLELLRSSDFNDGVLSWMNRREPTFKGA